MSQFVLDHAFDFLHLVVNVFILGWAMVKYADKAVISHLKNELKVEFFTKHDGMRLERKLDVVLAKVRHARRQLKEVKSTRAI